MSEYAGGHPQPRLEDLDNRGTLFEVLNQDDEARERLDIKADTIVSPKGVHVSLADRYADELKLLDITSGNAMRSSFASVSDRGEIVDRYGSDLPEVAQGARRNIRTGNQMIYAMYHAEELKQAGFDPQDIEDDVNLMRMQYRRDYAGPEHANDHAARRRFLRKKLTEFSSKRAS